MEELTAAAGGYTLVWYEEVDRGSCPECGGSLQVTAGHHTAAHCSPLITGVSPGRL